MSTALWTLGATATIIAVICWDLLGHRRYEVRIDGKPLLTRRRFLQNPLFAILLTRIHAPDPGRDPHNHSRSFITICLAGSYTETRHHPRHLSWTYRVRHRRLRPYYVRHWEPHRIAEIHGEPLTLVLAGPHHGTFWFWTPRGKIDWKDYRT